MKRCLLLKTLSQDPEPRTSSGCTFALAVTFFLTTDIEIERERERERQKADNSANCLLQMKGHERLIFSRFGSATRSMKSRKPMGLATHRETAFPRCVLTIVDSSTEGRKKPVCLSDFTRCEVRLAACAATMERTYSKILLVGAPQSSARKKNPLRAFREVRLTTCAIPALKLDIRVKLACGHC